MEAGEVPMHCLFVQRGTPNSGLYSNTYTQLSGDDNEICGYSYLPPTPKGSKNPSRLFTLKHSYVHDVAIPRFLDINHG